MRFLKFSKLFYISNFFVLFVLFFCIVNFVNAVDWTEPSVDPPAGNIDLPLNQGAVGQYKKGSLEIGSNSVVNDGYLFKVLSGPSLFAKLEIDDNGSLIMSPGSQILLSYITSKINLSNQASINLVGSSINLSSRSNIVGSTDRGDIISLTNTSIPGYGAGIYSYAPSSFAIDARTISGVAVFASSTNGNSIYSVSNGGLAGRFEGRVIVYDSPLLSKYVDLNDGRILVPFGFSSVIPDAVSSGPNSVYQDNTLVTKKLCFSDTDASGVQVGNLECMTETMGGPDSENSFIWNVGDDSHFSGVQYQTANMSLDGLISVKCNTIRDNGTVAPGGVPAENPSMGLKIGDTSYIYDSSCDTSSGSTLHIQSGEFMKITSTKLNISGSDVVVDKEKGIKAYTQDGTEKYILSTSGGSVTNAVDIGDTSGWNGGIRFFPGASQAMVIQNDGYVGIGTTTPLAKLHVNGSVYLDNITPPTDKRNHLYNAGGNLFWNGVQLNNTQESYWLLNGANLYTTSTVTKVGIGITSPEANLHVKTVTGNAEINIQSASSPKWGIYQDDTTDDLRFWNVDNRMTITNDGNVGIGTAAPAVKLDVNGIVNIRDDLYVSGDITATTVCDTGGNCLNNIGESALKIPGMSCAILPTGHRASWDNCVINSSADYYTNPKIRISGSQQPLNDSYDSVNRFCKELGYTGAYFVDALGSTGNQAKWNSNIWQIVNVTSGAVERVYCY